MPLNREFRQPPNQVSVGIDQVITDGAVVDVRDAVEVVSDRPGAEHPAAAVGKAEEVRAVVLQLPEGDGGEVTGGTEIVLERLEVDLDVSEPLLAPLLQLSLALQMVRNEGRELALGGGARRQSASLLLKLLEPSGHEPLRFVETGGRIARTLGD